MALKQTVKRSVIAGQIMVLFGCAYNTTYFNNMTEVNEAFPNKSYISVKKINDVHSEYDGQYKVKFKQY